MTAQRRRHWLGTGAALALAPFTAWLAGCGGGDSAAAAIPDDGVQPPVQRPPGFDHASRPSRSMTINLANRVEGESLAFADARASAGSVPSASSAAIGFGQQAAVYAANNGSCIGSFSLAGQGASFALSYSHPIGPGDTTVTVVPAAGYVAGADAATFPGHDSVANLNLYRGVKTASGAWVAPLELLSSPPRNNCQDLVNSLFAKPVRSAVVVRAANAPMDAQGLVPGADFSGGQVARLIQPWVAWWVSGGGLPDGLPGALTRADAALLAALRGYVEKAASTGPMVLWVPQLRWLPGAQPAQPAAYRLEGYRAWHFTDGQGAWQPDAAAVFLALLLQGAHLVAIHADADLPAGASVQAFDDWFAATGLPRRKSIGNSHYAGVVNTTGRYYLEVAQNFAPRDCGLLLAFLYGRTVNSELIGRGSYNTFMQLEGWQAGADRHNADYGIHVDTLWNISTFGASVYSEKRAGSVFLAPPLWQPQVYQTTRMMPYVGAYAVSEGQAQPWLHTELVAIADDEPALPARYLLYSGGQRAAAADAEQSSTETREWT